LGLFALKQRPSRPYLPQTDAGLDLEIGRIAAGAGLLLIVPAPLDSAKLPL